MNRIPKHGAQTLNHANGGDRRAQPPFPRKQSGLSLADERPR